MAFRGAATVVVAGSFQLLDPYGLVSGFLGNGNSVGAFPAATDFSELGLLHNDAAVVNSTLRWSRLTGGTGTAGDEYVVLRGPALAGANSNRPRIIVARTAALGTYVQLDSGRDNGAADATTGDIFMQTDLTQIRAKSLSILNSVETRMFDIAGPTDRGVVYGVKHATLVSNGSVPAGNIPFAVGLAETPIFSFNLPLMPLAGMLDIFWSPDVTTTAALGGYVTSRCYIDGVQLVTREAFVYDNVPGANHRYEASARGTMDMTPGTHLLEIRVLAQFAGTWRCDGGYISYVLHS